ncbi:Lysosomal pro-x carboxypeptidase [Globisporangium polare]
MPGKADPHAASPGYGPHHPPHPEPSPVKQPNPSAAALKPRDRTSPASVTAKSLLGAYATATNVIAIKKHDDHDAGQLLVERRLFASRLSHKLDLSLSSSSSSGGHTFPVTHHLFPRQVVLHEQMGHHLAELWLTNHSIAALPPEIGQFQSLRVLGLGGNALSSLPDELGRLSNLEALYLERNRFKTIVTTTVFPSQLRDLRLDRNQLTVFPLAVTKLRLLNCLGLSHNLIRVIPKEIRRLRNLVELELSFNLIGSELSEQEMKLLTKLERLGLEGNRLGADTLEWTKRMPALTFLRLSGNRNVTLLGSSNEQEEAGGDNNNQANEGVPVRHDGYFQCTRGYHSSGKEEANTDDDLRAPSDTPQLLDGLVVCREQNLLNAEIYRSGLAGGITHRKH